MKKTRKWWLKDVKPHDPDFLRYDALIRSGHMDVWYKRYPEGWAVVTGPLVLEFCMEGEFKTKREAVEFARCMGWVMGGK